MSREGRRGIRQDLGLVVLLIGGIAVGLLLAELGVRFFLPPGSTYLVFDAADAEPDGLYQSDPRLRLVHTPGFRGTVRGPGMNVDLRINSDGLRGDEIGPRDPSRPRWVVVGDSFTFAAQVREEDTFPRRLADLTGAEVLNGGVSSDCTWQSTVRYGQVADEHDVDGVVLVFFLGNDLYDNVDFHGFDKGYRPEAPPPEDAPTLRNRIRKTLYVRSHLYALLRASRRQAAVADGTFPAVTRWRRELRIFTASGQGQLTGVLETTRRGLAWLQEETGRRGDRLVVAVAPPVFAVDERRSAPTFELVGLDPADAALDAPAQAVLRELDRLGIAACDLTPDLRTAQQAGGEPYLYFDGHWSPEGHEVVARTLAECLGPL